MKVFVSGRIDDIENVRLVQRKLIDAGHKITHDWTKNETGDKMLAGREAKLADPKETQNRAVLDINGVMDADAYVICTNNKNIGKGMYVELGAAIALNEKTERPRIYLLGRMNHMTIFYSHPAVQKVKSVSEIIDSLKVS